MSVCSDTAARFRWAGWCRGCQYTLNIFHGHAAFDHRAFKLAFLLVLFHLSPRRTDNRDTNAGYDASQGNDERAREDIGEIIEHISFLAVQEIWDGTYSLEPRFYFTQRFGGPSFSQPNESISSLKGRETGMIGSVESFIGQVSLLGWVLIGAD